MPIDMAIPTSDGHPVRILLVEDSATDQELVRRAFREPAPLLGPVDLEVVDDADAALAAVRRATFAVILTDHSLPGRSGLELLRALRDADDRTPVVLMTGSGDEALAVSALQYGAADYVVKDLGFERTLPIVLERVLDKHAQELETEHGRQRAAQHAKRLERQVEDQTVSLRRALQESEALRRVGQALAAARDLKPALDLVTHTTAQLVRARAAAVMIRSDTYLVLASVFGALKQAPGLKSLDLCAALAAGWDQTTAAPLREGEVQIGLLWVARATAPSFSSHEVELLETLADMTALSIANVRAHEQLRRLATGKGARENPEEAPAAASSQSAPAARRIPPRPEPVDTGGLVVPPFPAALGRLLALAENDDATPEAVEEAVGLDPALATRAIQLASAAALGRARPASSLREALMVLGLRGIRNLAFAQFSRRLVVRWGLIDQLLWELSLAAAAGAQLLLEAQEPTEADDAYLCGLLHNVGAVALNNAYPERYERMVHRAIAEGCPVLEAEADEFGADGAAVTGQLVSSWSLPPRVARTLKNWRLGVSGNSPISMPLRWACTAALRMSPVWQNLLGERAEPGWIVAELESIAAQLDLSPTALDEVRRLIAARCEVLRGLVA